MSLNTRVNHPQQQKRRVQAREGDCVKGDLQQTDSSEIERQDLQDGSEACSDASLGSVALKKKECQS